MARMPSHRRIPGREASMPVMASLQACRTPLYLILPMVKGKSLSGIRAQTLADDEAGAAADLPVDAAHVFADEGQAQGV
jgi:hypothetical protein